MNYTKIVLYCLLAGTVLMLWNNWNKDQQTQQQNQTIAAAKEITALPNDEAIKIPADRIITVKTDVLSFKIDTLGGNIIEASLLKFAKDKKDPEPIQIMNDQAQFYFAQSGLVSSLGPDSVSGQAQYQTSQKSYVLNKGEKELHVDLHWNQAGLAIIKRFIFTPNNYVTQIKYIINNQTNQNWQGTLYTQFIRNKPQSSSATSIFGINSYEGASISTQEKAYKKVSFKDMSRKPINEVSRDGWVAMQQHYFLAAWVPDNQSQNHFYSEVNKDVYTVGQMGSEPMIVPANSIKEIGAKIYVGPEIMSYLDQVAPNLKLTIDYGWLWFISIGLFWLLQKIYLFVGNWGWSIILLTLFIKLAFYQLSATSYRSMANMRKIQPKMQALKEKFGEDKQGFNQAILEMYKKEKVNPFGGCLPVLVQIPVFIALYWVLMASVELRQAPFMGWIQDLSVRDPYFVLPLLMGLSMLIQQKLNPAPPDPMQAKVMMALPVVFTALFLYFPAGLVLYWVVNNTLSIIQQWYITRRYV